jgi:hypothetical protein
MTHHDPARPRMACGLVAIVLTAATFALLVVLPSTMGPDSPLYPVLAAAAEAGSGPCTISPACAEALADNARATVPPEVRGTALKCERPG